MKTKLVVLSVVAGVTLALAASSDSPKQESSSKKEEKAPDVAAQLEAAKQKLAKLRERYLDGHPAVQEQLRKIADLEKQLGAQKKK